MMTEDDIKKRISELLTEDKDNYSEILFLSNELAKFDNDNIRFSVDAGVIDRLGNELVARQETAVSELVKNAYDADATEVNLTFVNSTEVGGTLIISDKGNGMTKEQLINGFMRISSSEKIHNPYSEKYHRKRAGQKGIGRFAVQRLGSKLTIITQTEESEESLKLFIDWDIYSSDKDLYHITNSLESIPKKRLNGTTLIIENLRDKWSEASIKRIYRYVIEILQPFPLSQENVNQLDVVKNIEISPDPGFKIFFYSSPDGKLRKRIIDEKNMIYSHALATINGEINEEGIGKFSILSEKLDLDFSDYIGVDPDNKNAIFDRIRNVRFKAYYYVYGNDLIPKMHETSIRRLASTAGGIRLYRNGFRVLPYGETNDDWLGLDASIRRRSILPVHGNINFFGFVEIDDSSGDFEETSSREGLMTNESLIQLQNFLYRTIVASVIRIAEHRNVKIVSGQKKDEDGNWEKMEVRIKNIAHTLEELDKALEDEEQGIIAKKRRKKRVKALKKEIDEVAKIQKQERAKLFKERSMLRVLSSVGLTIGQFVHEIKYYLDNIQDDIKVLIQDLRNELEALNRLYVLDENFSIFKTYMSYFDYVISQNIIKELKPIELRTVVRPFIDSLKNDAKKSGIIFLEPNFQRYGLYTKPMHPSEWSSILFNFYTNSKKAIKRVSDKGEIFIECGDNDGFIYLEFSDTGDGISKENEEQIFEEFFTTTSQQTLDELDSNTEILGTGLGLKIVKDIVTSYRGNIRVVSPKTNFATCIRVEIPKANEKELDEYGI
jgi:signal transduction histidine kinase/anti-sigma regulatory factor (Ser/Thr protein kinase)